MKFGVFYLDIWKDVFFTYERTSFFDIWHNETTLVQVVDVIYQNQFTLLHWPIKKGLMFPSLHLSIPTNFELRKTNMAKKKFNFSLALVSVTLTWVLGWTLDGSWMHGWSLGAPRTTASYLTFSKRPFQKEILWYNKWKLFYFKSLRKKGKY